MIRACPACGSEGSRTVLVQLSLRTPDAHPLQGGYPVASCDRCGTGFADVEPPERYYAQYYASLAKYAIDAGGGGADMAPEPPWEADKADQMARQIVEYLGTTELSVLDVGCANGALLGGLERLGCRALTGVDPSIDAVVAANRRPFVTALVGSLPQLPPELGTYDCICLTGVLEHLWDPEAALRALLPLCHESTVIWAEVPDAARYLDPYLSPYEDFSTEHVNHFSSNSLKLLGARIGLEIVASRSYLAPLTRDVDTAVVAIAWRVGTATTVDPVLDVSLAETLTAYATRSALDFEHVAEGLAQGLAGADTYVLWGIGEYAFKLLALAPLSGRAAHAYVDRNPTRQALRFGGERVRDPSTLLSSDIPIVAGSLLQAGAIAHAARELGLQNPVVSLAAKPAAHTD